VTGEAPHRRPPRRLSRRRVVLIVAVAVALAALVVAPAALAAAGGGSAGFGGGGGEGGGGGGGGAGYFILIQILIRVAVLGHGLGALVLIGLFLLYLIFTRVVPQAQRSWAAQGSSGRKARRRVAERQRRVQAAAAEAAENDPVFAADAVKPAAAILFKQIQAAWDRGDRAALAKMIAPDLLIEWERRLTDLDHHGWRNRVQVLGEPTVEYVGLNHRGDAATDNVTVRIEARLRDYVVDRYGNHLKRSGRLSETVRVREFWTLRMNGRGRWMLASIEQGAEGAHALEEQIVATPWSDHAAMRDEALIEGAVAEAVPDGTKIAEVADLDFQGDARAAALDLSLADGRFSPDVLEVTARRATAAWAEAVDGADAKLRALAHPQAVRALLHPGGDHTRLVVRGPTVRRIRIVALDAGAEPPRMSVEVEVEGRRYLEDRDTTAVLAGSPSRPTTFIEHWTFALDGDAQQPWRIAVVGAPAART
jgi:predicted lipid-binding transport protein (Tim44 family)